MKDINDAIMLGAKEIHDLREENKRLKNIIKRYEDCLKKELKKVYSDTFIKWKIRELKGNDK